MKRQRQFGELEFTVLQAVRRKERASVRDVHTALGQGLKYTTVMTVMARLWAKGELKRVRVGRCYEYWVPNSPSRRSLGLLQRIVDKVFNGNVSALFAYLIESRPVSEEELAELEQVIHRSRSQV